MIRFQHNSNMNELLYGVLAGFAIAISAVAWKSFRSVPTMPKSFAAGNSGYSKLVLVVRTDLGMGKGKIAAQCSHATLGCYKKAVKKAPEYLKQWESDGQPKIVLKLDSVGEEGLFKLAEDAKNNGIVSTVIRDAGHTQVQSGTATVAGIGPCDAKAIDKITGHLKLLG